MEQPRSRRNRLDGPTVTKSFSLPRPIATAIEELAREEEHKNQSTIVLRALVEFLNRYRDPRAA